MFNSFLKYKQEKIELDDIRQLVKGSFSIADKQPLPGSSNIFGDLMWSFYDPTNPRLQIEKRSDFEINWAKYTIGTTDCKTYLAKEIFGHLKGYKGVLPLSIIGDLRRYFFAEISFGPLLYQTSLPRLIAKKSRNKSPRAAITTMKANIRFLGYLRDQCKQEGIIVNRLSDIDLHTVEKFAPSYPSEFSRFHKDFFFRVTLPLFKTLLDHPASFTTDDIHQVPWPRLIKRNADNRAKRGHVKRNRELLSDRASTYSYLPLHPEMFCWASNVFRALVSDMLDTLQLEREDLDPNPFLDELINRNLTIRQLYPDFLTSYQYILRNVGFSPRTSAARRKYEYIAGRSVDGVRYVKYPHITKCIHNARMAAQGLVFQYTGMRHSDGRAIRVDGNSTCLSDHLGFTVILGTHIKGITKIAPDKCDRWVTIDCLRDAVRLLEFLIPTNNNPYLMSSSLYIHASRPKPFEIGSHQRALCLLLAEYDFNGIWLRCVTERRYSKARSAYKSHKRVIFIKDKVPVHHHRFRGSLAAELARADCSLPYISKQLKHFHSVFTTYSKTSLSYGGQAEAAMERIQGRINPGLAIEIAGMIPTAREEIFSAYYNPNRKFAGGSAEAHKKHLKEFFDGKAITDAQLNKYIKQLANSGAPLSLCGFGFCNRRIVEGSESKVCDGDLCDPDCERHLILDTSVPIIIERFKYCIRELQKTCRKIYHPQWKMDKSKYSKYLSKLGQNPRKIEKDYLKELSEKR